MLTNKRKQRDRKRLIFIVSIFFGLFLIGGLLGLVISWKLFYHDTYLSPLSQEVIADTSEQEEVMIRMITAVLEAEEYSVQSIVNTGRTYTIVLKNGSEIVLSSEKDIKSQLSSLQFILQRLTMEGRRFSRLDLSFDKPVIVLEK